MQAREEDHISYTRTRSDPLYHKKLRGQIAPKPRLLKIVEFGGYYLRQSESPGGWSVDRYSRIRGCLLLIASFLW
jgi:hypothetical protein